MLHGTKVQLLFRDRDQVCDKLSRGTCLVRRFLTLPEDSEEAIIGDCRVCIKRDANVSTSFKFVKGLYNQYLAAQGVPAFKAPLTEQSVIAAGLALTDKLVNVCQLCHKVRSCGRCCDQYSSTQRGKGRLIAGLDVTMLRVAVPVSA